MARNIAVIGTGIMGSGIAANFLKEGHQVTIWNRTPEKTAGLQKLGATLASNPREATMAADIIFEVTANDESSQAVWHGVDGILAGASQDNVLIASATLTVNWIETLAAECATSGFTFFDMPLTGGRVAAENGILTLLVGGDESKLEDLRAELAAISSKLFYFGKAGSGMKYKLVLNDLQATHMVAFGEAMKLAKASGLDPAKVGLALCDRPGGIITQIAWDSYQKDKIPFTFSVNGIAKDLGYAKQLADGARTPILDDVLETYRKAQSDGHGAEDFASIIK